MSVLIKGMDMPTSEEKCKFFQPAPFRAPFCVINGVCHGIDDCPLKPIPPHGRLVDADALLVSENQHYEIHSDSFYVETRTIELAPTIIEAEET